MYQLTVNFMEVEAFALAGLFENEFCFVDLLASKEYK